MATTSTGTTGSRAGRAPGTGVLLVDTRDVDAARHQVATSYCPHALTVRGNGRGFHARHTTAGGEGVAVHRLGYGRDAVVVEPEPFGDFVLVSRPLRGILAVETGSEEVVVGAGSPVLLDPHDHHVLRFGPDCELLTVKLPRAAVERAAREVHPRGAGRVRTATAADPAAWDAVSRFLLTDAVGCGLVGGPGGGVAGDAFERQVVGLAAAALVKSFAPAPTEVAESSRTASAPASLRRALEFIDDHAAGAAGLREVAAAAGCSPRALQEAFRRHLDTTPTAHLRARRLAGARSELQEHPERSVAEVAHTWGFLHLGRFAADFRRAFGELPSRDRAQGTSGAQRTPVGPGPA